MSDAILVLGGTAEANALSKSIAERDPARRCVLSLAGRTAAPRVPAGIETRIGGFGGAEGLAAYLAAESIAHLVDATHPFAAGISRNAQRAAARAGIPRIALLRRPWTPGPDDAWQAVSCLGAAAKALPPGARPFLALGRQHLAPFRHRPDIFPIVRMIDPPEEPLPFAARLVLGRPAEDARAEVAMLRETGATHLVCRNSGGEIGFTKLLAARLLALPAIVIERPEPPAPPLAASAGEVLAALGL